MMTALPPAHVEDGGDDGSATKITSKAGSTTSLTDDNGTVPESDTGVWSRFKGFRPNPGASFNNEFWRLSKHQGWTQEERRQYRVEMFDADFTAHFGDDVGDLSMWQEFCRLCGIDPIPAAIPECIEVST
jgi:hypothetical protein